MAKAAVDLYVCNCEVEKKVANIMLLAMLFLLLCAAPSIFMLIGIFYYDIFFGATYKRKMKCLT